MYVPDDGRWPRPPLGPEEEERRRLQRERWKLSEALNAGRLHKAEEDRLAAERDETDRQLAALEAKRAQAVQAAPAKAPAPAARPSSGFQPFGPESRDGQRGRPAQDKAQTPPPPTARPQPERPQAPPPETAPRPSAALQPFGPEGRDSQRVRPGEDKAQTPPPTAKRPPTERPQAPPPETAQLPQGTRQGSSQGVDQFGEQGGRPGLRSGAPSAPPPEKPQAPQGSGASALPKAPPPEKPQRPGPKHQSPNQADFEAGEPRPGEPALDNAEISGPPPEEPERGLNALWERKQAIGKDLDVLDRDLQGLAGRLVPEKGTAAGEDPRMRELQRQRESLLEEEERLAGAIAGEVQRALESLGARSFSKPENAGQAAELTARLRQEAGPSPSNGGAPAFDQLDTRAKKFAVLAGDYAEKQSNYEALLRRGDELDEKLRDPNLSDEEFARLDQEAAEVNEELGKARYVAIEAQHKFTEEAEFFDRLRAGRELAAVIEVLGAEEARQRILDFAAAIRDGFIGGGLAGAATSVPSGGVTLALNASLGAIIGALGGVVGTAVARITVTESDFAALPGLLESNPQEAAKILGRIGDAQIVSFLVSTAFGGISPLKKGGYSVPDALGGAAGSKASQEFFER